MSSSNSSNSAAVATTSDMTQENMERYMRVIERDITPDGALHVGSDGTIQVSAGVERALAPVLRGNEWFRDITGWLTSQSPEYLSNNPRSSLCVSAFCMITTAAGRTQLPPVSKEAMAKAVKNIA